MEDGGLSLELARRTPIETVNFQINSGPHRYSVTVDAEEIGGWNERPLVTASGRIILQEIFILLSCYFHILY